MSFGVIPTIPPCHLSRADQSRSTTFGYRSGSLTSDDLAEQGEPGADLEGAEVALHDPPLRP